LCVTQFVRASELANEVDRMVKLEPNPSEHSCFSNIEVGYLAAYKKECDVCHKNLGDTKRTLQSCISNGAPATRWWADPSIVIGGWVIGLSLGAAIGVLVAK